jgi:NTP pyrophosphatase (non-canonical NTP hydrolase)
MDIKTLQKEIHQVNKDNGWYDGSKRSPLEMHALIISEVAEATEEARKGRMDTYYSEDRPGKPEGHWTELADALIRILDYAESENVDLEDIILTKLNFNKTRSYRHGSKKY